MGKYTDTHKLYFNKDGKEVPSATTILKILNKPAIATWANCLGFKQLKLKDVLDDSADFGTLVHEIISAHIKGHYYIYCPNGRVPRCKLLAALDNFLKWYNNNDIKPILSEEEFTSDLYGGTVDFYGKVNGKYTIVDFKTSKKIRITMFFQLALYTKLLEENGYKVEQVGIVLCNEKKDDTKFISRDELNKYIDVADILVHLFHKYYNLNENDEWGDSII